MMAIHAPALALLVALQPLECERLRVEVCVGEGYEVHVADGTEDACEAVSKAQVRLMRRGAAADSGTERRTGRFGRVSFRVSSPLDDLLLDVLSSDNGGLVGVPIDELAGTWRRLQAEADPGTDGTHTMALRVKLKPSPTSCAKPQPADPTP